MLRLIGLANCCFWISRSDSLRPASLMFKAVKGARPSLVMYSLSEIDLPKITKVLPRRALDSYLIIEVIFRKPTLG